MLVVQFFSHHRELETLSLGRPRFNRFEDESSAGFETIR
jgi:hypothetical protein